MFVDFFLYLRETGLKVSLTEYLALVESLSKGLARAHLDVFYHLARALWIKRESDYDHYDRAFATFFRGVEAHVDLSDELLGWLANPVLPRALSPEELAALKRFDFDTLREELLQRLREQRERHDGGSHWVGTGGTSPFGHGGKNPQGIRIGGSAAGRSAVYVAESRRFRNLRHDRILDTRQIGAALKKLRQLGRDRGPEELDVEATIDKCAKNAGELELIFAPPKKNRVKLLLLMDVGGSMDPHVALCERLFSAAHAATHFKAFKHYAFHNCVYGRLYTDMTALEGPPTREVLQGLDSTWSVILVGDAWMSPYELTAVMDGFSLESREPAPGIEWLRRLRARCPTSVWLNPEPIGVWESASTRLIRQIFPMFSLTLDGLGAAVDVLRGSKPNRPGLRVEP
ncbi:MAG: VWA domain-containing protein [Deltaproteobacteria bacterium]|nr:VWA domain-containing protein [Deltaproteobacteria bacterium]